MNNYMVNIIDLYIYIYQLYIYINHIYIYINHTHIHTYINYIYIYIWLLDHPSHGWGRDVAEGLREDPEAPVEAVGEGVPGLVVRDLGAVDLQRWKNKASNKATYLWIPVVYGC